MLNVTEMKANELLKEGEEEPDTTIKANHKYIEN